MADLDLRLVRYFTVLAEHGNFHRAADALHLAQPSLSRQIQRLEVVLGVRLLERSRQGSNLTEAGRVFLPQAQELLRTARQAAATTRAAVRAGDLTIGWTGDLPVTGLVRELRERHAAIGVRTRHLTAGEVQPALAEHHADAVLTREPFPGGELTVTPLFDEPRMLLMPVTHRLAGRRTVTLDDFAREPLVRYDDPVYDAFWRIDPRPDGGRAPGGPLATTAWDKLELVAGGQALALTPAPATPRPDLVAIPVEGIPPCRVVLATRATDHRPVISHLRALAVELLGQAAAPGSLINARQGEPTARAGI
ncbi:LysR family transcriptional regulator [Winogradskya humida]|uniref:LysR family transcriptional regulator n=1 Tax=Winogradskya humida TaxID=113566 RepID=UPI001EF2E2B5|nr:LysR family transcriptional regulator [Actinoplanes humidus]